MEKKTYVEAKVIQRLTKKYKERYGYLNCNTIGYIKKDINKNEKSKSDETSFRATDYLMDAGSDSENL